MSCVCIGLAATFYFHSAQSHSITKVTKELCLSATGVLKMWYNFNYVIVNMITYVHLGKELPIGWAFLVNNVERKMWLEVIDWQKNQVYAKTLRKQDNSWVTRWIFEKGEERRIAKRSRFPAEFFARSTCKIQQQQTIMIWKMPVALLVGHRRLFQVRGELKQGLSSLP